LLTCKEFLQELNQYLDEDIDAELRCKLESHVNACPNCFVIFDTTKRTIQVYKGMEAQTIPSEVHSRLMAALEKRMAARKKQCDKGGVPGEQPV
jgi:anti-sigma factor (TIGR02949 family)